MRAAFPASHIWRLMRFNRLWLLLALLLLLSPGIWLVFLGMSQGYDVPRGLVGAVRSVTGQDLVYSGFFFGVGRVVHSQSFYKGNTKGIFAKGPRKGTCDQKGKLQREQKRKHDTGAGKGNLIHVLGLGSIPCPTLFPFHFILSF